MKMENLQKELQKQLDQTKALNTPKKITKELLEQMRKASLNKTDDYYYDEKGNKIKR